MELANYIETSMKSILKNPIYEVLSEIKITKILNHKELLFLLSYYTKQKTHIS